MFAIIEEDSRQYKVQKGDILRVDYRSDAEPGQAVSYDKVLLANAGGASVIGKPIIEGAEVKAEIVVPLEKGIKLEIQKIRRRKNSRRHTGHRQKYTSVRILDITVPGLEVIKSAEQPAPKEDPAPAETPAESTEE